VDSQKSEIALGKKWGEKIMQFPLTRMTLALLFVLLPVGVIGFATSVLTKHIPGNSFKLTSSVLIVIVALAGYYAYVRLVEKRPVTELSRLGAGKELGLGLLVGACFLLLVIGILALLGIYQVSGVNHWTIIFTTLPAFIIAGFVEEIIARGIIFRILEASLGSWLAIAISAAIFGFGHLTNPGATLLNASAITIEAGVMLAAAFMLTRRLWLCIGMHLAWNIMQGTIFSVAVSGMKMQGLFKATMVGPEWLTGGTFGAEASLVAVIICTAGGIFFLYRAIQKGNLIQPYWKRNALNLQALPATSA
jgi:membrane protease YdiL (CAAX protease family)